MSAADPRDRAVDGLLRRALGEAPVDARQCPDAETLAAWMDGALTGAPLQSTETHVAGCARCQAITAGMTVAAAAAISADDTAPARGWFDWRWMVPLAAGAAAVLAWAVLPDRLQTTDTLARGGDSSPAVEALPAQPSEAQPAAPSERPSAPTNSASSPAAEDRARAAAGNESAAGAPSRRAEASSNAAEPKQETVIVTGAAPMIDVSATERERSADSLAEAAPAPEAPPLAPTVQMAPAAPAAERARTGQPVFKAAVSVAWRVNDGRVERSADSGASWQDVPVPSPVRAVSSPSTAVVWTAGNGGLVLRSIDGAATWQTLTAPAPTDLVRIDATDDQHAIVTDATGARFETKDSGVTWRGIGE